MTSVSIDSGENRILVGNFELVVTVKVAFKDDLMQATANIVIPPGLNLNLPGEQGAIHQEILQTINEAFPRTFAAAAENESGMGRSRPRKKAKNG